MTENNISSRDILQANSIVIVGSLIFFTLSGTQLGIISGFLLIIANYFFVLSIVHSLSDKMPMPQRLRPNKDKVLGRSMWLFVIGLLVFFFVMFIIILKEILPLLVELSF